MSNARDVYAFLIEISMLPSHAPSIRTCETKFPPPSATAIFIGCLISAAFFSAAAITLRASLNVIIFQCPPGRNYYKCRIGRLKALQRKFLRGQFCRLRLTDTSARRKGSEKHRAAVAISDLRAILPDWIRYFWMVTVMGTVAV
jgi:hypothetical protein